jgi:hypothetical protein
MGVVDKHPVRHVVRSDHPLGRRVAIGEAPPARCSGRSPKAAGTTIIAAEMTGRKCFAIEINPAYVDVCVERWQNFSSKEAILIGTDMTYAQVKDQRKNQ